MQTYLIYGVLFLCVVLLVESVSLFLRSRIGGDEAANRRIRMIEKTGDEMIGLELVKAARSQQNSSLVSKFESLLWAANLPPNLPLIAGGVVGFGLLLTILLMGFAGFPPLNAIMLGIIAAAAIAYVFIAQKARRRRKLFQEQLIPSIDLVSRGLQAGHPAAVALEIVAREMPDPIGSEFGMAIDEISFGLDRDVAMRNVGERFPSPDMAFFTSALEIQRETGGNLVEVLNNLTTMMRDRRAMEQKIKAVSSEGRITALVVGVMPFIMILILTYASPGYFSENFDNPIFFPLMAIPAGFYVVGMYMIRRLINIRI